MTPAAQGVVQHLEPAAPEALAARVRRLQAEAKTLAVQHVQSLEAALAAVIGIADEVANGGGAYPPGVRDLAARIALDSNARVQTLHAIRLRTTRR